MNDENESFIEEKLAAWRASLNNAIDDIREQRHKIDYALIKIVGIEDELKDIAMAMEKEQDAIHQRIMQEDYDSEKKAAESD